MDVVTQVVLPSILAFIMFSMGLDLTTKDFTNILKYPKAFFIGSLLQVFSLPLIAFVLAKIWLMGFDIDPALAVGLVIISACPGGVTSNLMTHLAKGDSALSVSLTAFISILSVFTLPLIVKFGLNHFMPHSIENDFPIFKTIFGIFCITTIPVFLGMLIKAKNNKLAEILEPKAKLVATILFVIIILAAIIKKWTLLKLNIMTVGPFTLALNLITMFVAIMVAKAFQLKSGQKIAIALECGLQNGTLAIMVAMTFLKNETMMIPGGVYSILMFITGAGFLYLQKKNRKLEASKAF